MPTDPRPVKAGGPSADVGQVALQYRPGQVVGDGPADLLDWLRGLEGCPPVTHAVLVGCRHDDGATPSDDVGADVGWSYVEADARAGVARRRCVACARATSMLDSDERWTWPAMFSCPSCRQSIVEIGIGLSGTGPAGAVGWLAVGVRCVACGTIAGVTDMQVAPGALDEVVAAL